MGCFPQSFILANQDRRASENAMIPRLPWPVSRMSIPQKSGKSLKINKMLESVTVLAMELDVSVGVLMCAYTASLSPAMGLCIEKT